MLFVEPGHFELAKMAVAEEFRGQGIGQRLVERAIEWARRRNARVITLLSHSKLSAAVRLYTRNGFERVPFDPSATGYERCDIAMRLRLKSE
jgi:GNAT superfamily N-acetyltransferase